MPQPANAAEAVAGAVDRLPDLVAADAGLRHRARHTRLDILFEAGDARWFLTFEHGRLAPPRAGTRVLAPSTIAFAAAPEIWLRHWRRLPAPGDHDLFALVKNGQMRCEGDVMALMRHLQVVKDLLAAPRSLFAEA